MKRVNVTVAYALPSGATLIEVSLPASATIAEAIALSGIEARHPEIVLAGTPIGVFGQRALPHATLIDGDRIELYRPLIADPKEARRRRAATLRRG